MAQVAPWKKGECARDETGIEVQPLHGFAVALEVALKQRHKGAVQARVHGAPSRAKKAKGPSTTAVMAALMWMVMVGVIFTMRVSLFVLQIRLLMYFKVLQWHGVMR